MPSLGVFVGLHSIWYWWIQQFAHTTEWTSIQELESNVPRKRRHGYRDVVASFFINAITLMHTCGVLALGFPKNNADTLDIFRRGSPEELVSPWIVSQYAIELMLMLWGFYRHLWNPLERLRKDMLLHHGLSLAMLGASYASHYTSLGSLVITITNSTNLFYDYFKYGRLTDDVYTKWVSSALFTVVFFLARIHLLGATILLPLTYDVFYQGAYDSIMDLGQLGMLYILFGLECVWFYKLVGYTVFQTERLMSQPMIRPHIPDRIRTMLNLEAESEPESEPESEHESEPESEPIQSAPSASNTQNTPNIHKEIFPEIQEDPKPTAVQEFETLHRQLESGIEETLSQWRNMIEKQINTFSNSENKIGSEIAHDKKNS